MQREQTPTVMAVVITYNRKTLLLECIQALLGQRTQAGQGSTEPLKAALDILVVDNHSTDGTHEAVAPLLETYPQLHYVCLEENLGGAGGFHYGMKKAVEQGCDYVWIMDDDTIPGEKALYHLLEAAELLGKTAPVPEQPFGFLSSVVEWTDGSLCNMNRQQLKKGGAGRPPYEGVSLQRWQELAARGMIPVESATFVSLLFPTQVVVQEGLPLKEYFIWGDDKEYTLRLSAKHPCYMVEKSRVVHKMNTNAGSNITTDEVARISRYFYAYRNDLATAKKRGIKEVIVYFAAFLLNVVRVILFSHKEKGQRIRTMFAGMGAGIGFSPEVEYTSQKTQGKHIREVE